jgi:hypothetical protein
MPPDEYEFLKVLVGHLRLLDSVLARIESSIDAAPIGQRDELEAIHERLSNVVGVMRSDLLKLC